jgi:hypothetical protein
MNGTTSRNNAGPGRAPIWRASIAFAGLLFMYLMICIGSWFFGSHRCESVLTTSNLDANLTIERTWIPPGVVCILTSDDGKVLLKD